MSLKPLILKNMTIKKGEIYSANLDPTGDANIRESSKIKANQIRTIDKSRLMQKIGTVNAVKLKEVEKAILIHLDIVTN